MANLAFTSYPITSTGGSYPRTMPDRYLDVINVKDFGAVGDGVTDDWDAIGAAMTWNNARVVLTARAYSGAVRVATVTWAAGSVTLTTTEAHGWIVGDLIKVVNMGGPGPGDWNGSVAVATVPNTTTITYALATDPRAAGDIGCVLPQITGVTWASNTVTVDYGAPHRFPIGTPINCNVTGLSSGTGDRTITATTARQLTFPLTGSGAITATEATIRPKAILNCVSVPAAVTLFNTYLAGEFPRCDAAYFNHQVTAKTSTTITLGTSGNVGLQADIAAGATVRLATANRGAIFFPPGTYNISQQIKLGDPTLNITLIGSGASSVIQGSIAADYLMYFPVRSGGPMIFEKLKFKNTHATGRGLGAVALGYEVRDCIFDTNVGLNLAGPDYVLGLSFAAVVSNCIFTPGASATNSVGIMLAINQGTVAGNYFKGLGEGIRSEGFGQMVMGNQFIDCTVAGIDLGWSHTNVQYNTAEAMVAGNYFKNNGIGIWPRGGGGTDRFEGNYIEGGAGATHGLRVATGNNTRFSGLDITGTFATAGVVIESSGRMPVRSVRSLKSGVSSWTFPTTPSYVVGCNTTQLRTFSQLPGEGLSTAPSWAAGVVTLTTVAAHGMTIGTASVVIVEGVTVGGSTANNYNGVFSTSTVSGSTVTYALASNPGAAAANAGCVASTGSATNSLSLRSIDWAANVVSVETWGNHALTPGSTVDIRHVLVGGSSNTLYNSYNNSGVIQSGVFPASAITITGATTFTYALVAADPGVVDSACLPATVNDTGLTIYAFVTIANSRTNLSRSVYQGNMYHITDGALVGGGTANIGDRVQGSGSQHIKVGWTINGWVRYG